MIILLSVVIIAFLFGLWLEEGDFLVALFIAFWGAVAGFLLALVIGAIVYNSTAHVPVPLENLVDNTQIHGRFFLGSGTIDEVPVYVWYEQTDNNTFRQNQINVDQATIHYLLDKRRPYYVATFHNKKGFFREWGWDVNPSDVTHIDFYVPRGTITNNYTLDAKP